MWVCVRLLLFFFFRCSFPVDLAISVSVSFSYSSSYSSFLRQLVSAAWMMRVITITVLKHFLSFLLSLKQRCDIRICMSKCLKMQSKLWASMRPRSNFTHKHIRMQCNNSRADPKSMYEPCVHGRNSLF